MNPARFLFSIWVTPVLLCSLQRIFIFILFKDNPFLSHTAIHFYPGSKSFFSFSSLPSRLCLFSLSGTGIDSVTQLSSAIHQIMLLSARHHEPLQFSHEPAYASDLVNGIFTVKTLPSPWILSTLIEPRNSCTAPFVIASPSPVPPISLEWDLSTR